MTEVPQQPIYRADVLRKEGKIAGKRPEFPLARVPLEIKGMTLADAPKGPVDVAIAFGMGPVPPVLIGPDNNRFVVSDKSRSSNNAVAAAEAAAHGLIKKDGVIIPSGTATADPIAVEAAIAQREAWAKDKKGFIESLGSRASLMSPAQIDALFEQSFRRLPTREEIDKIYTATEANIMARLIAYARPKGGGGQTIEALGFHIRPDNGATETTENFINVLNDLDEQSRKENGTMFTGSIAAITSRYHIARTMEIARFLNLEGTVVPLVSQVVLKDYGYNPNRLLSPEDAAFDENTRWGEQRWIRTLHQMPEYFLPELAKIKDNERFLNTLKHVQSIYGTAVFGRYGLLDANMNNVEQMRMKLKAITRTNPLEEEWLKTDTKEVNTAIDSFVHFTSEWIAANTRNYTPLPPTVMPDTLAA